MDFQLTDRVVVITGAGSGIGLATAKTFLAEGAKVVAADLDPSAAGELSNSVAALAVDMSTPDGADFVIAEAMRMHGRVDVLVNNVGAFPFRESFLAVSDTEWHRADESQLLFGRPGGCFVPRWRNMVRTRARRNSVRGLRCGTFPRPILRRLQRFQGRGTDDVEGRQHRSGSPLVFAPTVSRRARREHRRGIGRVASATRWRRNTASTKRRLSIISPRKSENYRCRRSVIQATWLA